MTWISRRVPLKRSSKPIARRARPRSRIPKALGTHRERVKYANDLWRRLIYAKEPSGICPRCRARKWHDAAHCFAKGPYPALRFELENGAPLCRPCHTRVDSDHHAKVEFFTRYIGAVEYERLRLRALSRAKSDLALTILYLERASRSGAAVVSRPVGPT
ncbi:hypothetical protein [Longimicrobium sp.]|uniref:hypothetical protein n=1 Tax=Longimicrobium sp. TaxID=2029185 RepID=UPI002E308620|nr:hypothetical protein [Longimicrobium sp.]HEX6038886.1 hypothetical protein [Longimicrobium sp.]